LPKSVEQRKAWKLSPLNLGDGKDFSLEETSDFKRCND